MRRYVAICGLTQIQSTRAARYALLILQFPVAIRTGVAWIVGSLFKFKKYWDTLIKPLSDPKHCAKYLRVFALAKMLKKARKRVVPFMKDADFFRLFLESDLEQPEDLLQVCMLCQSSYLILHYS